MNPENSILLIVNPIAGDNDKQHIIERLRSETKSRNLLLEIYETTGKNDKQSIEDLIEKVKPSRVLVAGGDGTVSMVAESLMGKDICLAMIPSGSANGMAANIQMPTDLSEQIELALTEPAFKIDMIFIDGKPCLHIADLGINAELVKNYENSNIRGKLGYFLQTIPTLINSEGPLDFIIETEEGIIEESGVLLAIANANKFGTGANINPGGRINDGKFEILIFKNLDFIEILKTVQEEPKLSPEFVRVISTHKANIKNKTLAPLQIDGEFIGEVHKVQITIEREILSLAVPQSFRELQNLKSKNEYSESNIPK